MEKLRKRETFRQSSIRNTKHFYLVEESYVLYFTWINNSYECTVEKKKENQRSLILCCGNLVCLGLLSKLKLWCALFIIYLLFFTEDLRGKLGPVLYSPNFSVKKRDEHLQSTVFTWLSYFEKLAPVNSTDEGIDGLYFASERLTWVDYVLFDLLDTYVEFGKLAFDGQAEVIDVLANFPRLKAFYENFASRPRIAKYLRAERRVPFRL